MPATLAAMVGDLVARAMRALRDAFRPSGVGSGFVADLKAAGLPGATEIERLVVQRVGQDVFRAGLLEYWDGRRAVTGLAVPELLRASHIKPWADCATDAERLDVFNGLLLAPHLDAAFDRGFITVGDDGAVLVSASLRREDAKLIGMDTPLGVKALADAHRRYLAWHRSHLFKSASEAT